MIDNGFELLCATFTMEFKAARTYILERLREELSTDLCYHGLHHTMDVLQMAIEIGEAEKLSKEELILLETAALFHDSGFVVGPVNHESRSCEIAKNILPTFGYEWGDIQKICGMIMATKIPQSPQNKLEAVLCDADLDYLGRSDFWEISDSLYQELLNMGNELTPTSWDRIQIQFFNSHHYFTQTNINRRKAQKQEHLAQLEVRLAEGENR